MLRLYEGSIQVSGVHVVALPNDYMRLCTRTTCDFFFFPLAFAELAALSRPSCYIDTTFFFFSFSFSLTFAEFGGVE